MLKFDPEIEIIYNFGKNTYQNDEKRREKIMNSILNWLYRSPKLMNFLKKMAIVLSVVLIGFGYFFGLTLVVNFIIKMFNKNYLLTSMTLFNNIVCFIVPIIVAIIVYFVNRAEKQATYRVYTDKKHIKRSKWYIGILVVLGMIFIYSANNYTAVYDGKIKTSSFLNLLGKEYSYSDIEEISVGVNKNINFSDMYYYVKFTDGKKVNLSNGVLGRSYDINKLVEFNEHVVESNTKRTVDDTYKDVFVKNLNEEYKEKYMELLK